MPELPEVEVTRRGLEPQVQGLTIEGVYLGKPLRWPLEIAPERLVGSSITRVARRSKYLLMHLDRGVLLIHLGMSGSIFVAARAHGGLLEHEHFGMKLGSQWLTLRDPRRFGAVVWVPSLDAPSATKLLGHLGPEPWSEALTNETFWQALRASRAPIKQVLLAGKAVCGVGNIYASEALFLAGIRPQRRASAISRARATRLLLAIRQVLQLALDSGGSSLKDFRNSAGEMGQFQTLMQVYDREGQACSGCVSPIRAIRQGQRSTFYCPKCQR